MVPSGPLLALLAVTSTGPEPVEGHPWAHAPITVIVIDDLGFDFLERAHTPHLDAIADAGVSFTNFWSYPNCSASRAALLTGRHATRTGVGSILGWENKTEPALGLHETTFAELLNEPADAFGKWHLSFRHTDPNDQGFQHYKGSMGNLNGTGKNYYEWMKTEDGVVFRETEYATKVTTDDALASTASLRYIAYHAVHSPHNNPPGGTATTTAGKHVEMIEYLDQEIGRLMTGYDGYVFVLSENGTAKFLGGDKGALSEGGINVPFFVAGPGIRPAVRDDLVGIVDLFATLADMRGVPSTAEDSISFLPILQGQPGVRHLNYAETFNPNGNTAERQWAIRNRTHKLRFFRWPVPHQELYRMPGEVVVVPPYTGADLAAYESLRERLPFDG